MNNQDISIFKAQGLERSLGREQTLTEQLSLLELLLQKSADLAGLLALVKFLLDLLRPFLIQDLLLLGSLK